MNYLLKNLDTKRNKTFLFYIIYIVVISVLLFIGLSGNIHADTANSQQNSNTQYKVQNSVILPNSSINHDHEHNWFRDGLDTSNLKARGWVSWHESHDNWRVLSYGHRCIGYFQLDPSYLGYKNGHVNLNHRHQVKVADAYAQSRYGDWINAKQFWKIHHYY